MIVTVQKWAAKTVFKTKIQVLIFHIFFCFSPLQYLGSSQIMSPQSPNKAVRMEQAQEAVGRIKVGLEAACEREFSRRTNYVTSEETSA